MGKISETAEACSLQRWKFSGGTQAVIAGGFGYTIKRYNLNISANTFEEAPVRVVVPVRLSTNPRPSTCAALRTRIRSGNCGRHARKCRCRATLSAVIKDYLAGLLIAK
jgi:hypothetical protein